MDFFWAFPFRSRYPLYLFCLIRTKKDAAFIANAALKQLYAISDVKQFNRRAIAKGLIPRGLPRND